MLTPGGQNRFTPLEVKTWPNGQKWENCRWSWQDRIFWENKLMNQQKKTLTIFHRPPQARRHLPFDLSGYHNIWLGPARAVILIPFESFFLWLVYGHVFGPKWLFQIWYKYEINSDSWLKLAFCRLFFWPARAREAPRTAALAREG